MIAEIHRRISHGWSKYNDMGQIEYVGSPPYYDLYRVVRENRLSTTADALYLALAQTILQFYPNRVTMDITTDIKNPIDARICIIDFNNHQLTHHADVIRVVRWTTFGKQSL